MLLTFFIRLLGFVDTNMDEKEKAVAWATAVICSLILIYNVVNMAS
jgi:hypothetical protein